MIAALACALHLGASAAFRELKLPTRLRLGVGGFFVTPHTSLRIYALQLLLVSAGRSLLSVANNL